jgi:hypothetical protein
VLLGDSALYAAGARNPAFLPAIAHDTGTAGITATTTAQIVIRYFAMTHSMDGPAVNTSGADVRIDNFHVNPGASSVKIGRGILVRDAPTFAALADISVRNVRGYGVRLERATQGQVDRVTVVGVDSIAGTRGAGIDVYRGSLNTVRFATVRGAQGPAVLLDSTATGSAPSSCACAACPAGSRSWIATTSTLPCSPEQRTRAAARATVARASRSSRHRMCRCVKTPSMRMARPRWMPCG